MKPIHKKFFKIVMLLWGCCFICFLVFYVVFLEPQTEKIKLLEKKLVERRQEYKKSEKAQSIKGRTEKSRKIEQLTQQVKSFVSEVDDLGDLTFRIGNIVSGIGVEAFESEKIGSELYLEMPNCKYIGYAELVINFKSGFSKYRHLKQGINLVKSMGYEAAIRLYQEDPIAFRKLL